jgi:hypothetical protein
MPPRKRWCWCPHPLPRWKLWMIRCTLETVKKRVANEWNLHLEHVFVFWE